MGYFLGGLFLGGLFLGGLIGGLGMAIVASGAMADARSEIAERQQLRAWQQESAAMDRLRMGL